MKKLMLDILACPIDKRYPLELFELESKSEIEQGVLYCQECGRYYPIIDGIPVMLPDELRERKRDIDFLAKWGTKLPDKVLRQGNPWHI